jgi:hypothetical protein
VVVEVVVEVAVLDQELEVEPEDIPNIFSWRNKIKSSSGSSIQLQVEEQEVQDQLDSRGGSGTDSIFSTITSAGGGSGGGTSIGYTRYWINTWWFRWRWWRMFLELLL